MRFLMLNWRDPKNPLSGGAERVTMGYLKGLLERGHECYWFANAFPNALAEETIQGVRIIRGGGKGGSILAVRRWYRKQLWFDLVIDQHHGLPWFAPWWCGTNCVAYVHEVLGPIWDVFYRRPTSTIGKWQERRIHWLYRRVTFWTASNSTREGLSRHGVRQIQLIPYGVDTEVLPSLPAKTLEQPLRLIMVSRLAPNKRLDHGILAAKCLQQRGLDVRLRIVGGGDMEGALRRLVEQEGLKEVVSFAGQLSENEKDQLLQESHFLLHTSLREGWGLNVIEANARGTPAAVYPVAGLTDSTHHDKTGLVAERETPETLAKVIEWAVQNPGRYQGYRERGRALAASFHWNQVLPSACEWLEKQARGPKGSHGTGH